MKVRLAFLRMLLLPSAVALAGTAAACQGCRGGPSTTPGGDAPTVRLYLASSVAGALEPCGCSKNQLGGFDHLGAFVASQKSTAKASLVAAAGPLFFLDPAPRKDQATQDEWKADAIALAFQRVGLAAWAPGANDWTAGGQKLRSLRERSGAAIVAANLRADAGAGARPFEIREAGGYKVGFVGVSVPGKMGVLPEGVESEAPEAKLTAAVEGAKAAGAQILVGLFALPRGDALRVIERAPGLHVAVLGKPFDQGEGNDKPAPPRMMGTTLVVEPANHLQTVGVVDLHVRDGSTAVFQDAAGIDQKAERESLMKRRDELSAKIRAWEQNSAIKKDDLEARRSELSKVVDDLRKLETPPAPAKGSFFRYTMQEIRVDLGKDDAIYGEMLAYYQRVNDHNREAFKGRVPPPPGPDGNKYAGIEACSSCHAAARAVWDKTEHGHAYKTLEDQHKEFNLDCVSCHVTGYEKPGGSTVTVNAPLRNVQCEECHGPGEKHRQNPADKSLIVGRPKPEGCVSACHHPPHVEGFDPVAQMHKILGAGHGNPDEWPPKKPR
jgi:hypothetical protein